MSRTRWLGLATAALIATAVLPGSAAYAEPGDGTITGHLLDGTTPIRDSQVFVQSLDFSFSRGAILDGDGAFSIGDVPPGQYLVSFALTAGNTQIYHQAETVEQAQVITITEGATVNIEEQPLPHGTIGGRVTLATGAPMSFGMVTATRSDGFTTLRGATNGNGDYELTYAPPGSYTLEFRELSGATHYYHQKSSQAAADRVTVAVGATTRVDEQFLAMGAIAGRLTDGGLPVAFANVLVEDFQNLPTSALTDQNGDFRVAVPPGQYVVSFNLPNGLRQYYHGKTGSDVADRVTVSPDATTVVNETTLPHGTLTGRLTDAAGAPVASASVSATGPNNTFGFTNTDADGRWSIEAFAGTYRVAFGTQFGTQYAHGKTSEATADPIVLSAGGQVVTVDDALAIPGTITVTARHAVTGLPVTEFCSTAFGLPVFECATNGQVVLTALPGSYLVHVSPLNDDLLTENGPTVSVASGQHIAVTVTLTPAAKIVTVVRDARTNAPVEGICLEAIRADSPTSLGHNTQGTCSDATGRVTIPSLRAAKYNVFAWANDNVHGHQWVGAHGGVGAQADARVVNVTVGASVTLPAIKLDGRGSLTGVVSDPQTHTPLAGAAVGIATFNSGFGPTAAQAFTDDQGRYTFAGLGPYKWTIFSSAFGYAPEWSGHTPNRLKAKGVKVRANKVQTYDIGLSRGVSVTGIVTTPDGVPVPLFGARITAVHAASHDEVTAIDTDANGRYTLHLLGNQAVTLRVQAFLDGREFDFLVNNGNPVQIPRHGTVTLNITLR